MPEQNIPDSVKLIHDLNCTDPDEMHFPVLADRVRYFKETPEGQAEIFRMFDEARKEAAKEITLRIASSLTETNFSVEDIAGHCGLTVDEVLKIKEEKNDE